MKKNRFNSPDTFMQLVGVIKITKNNQMLAVEHKKKKKEKENLFFKLIKIT